MGSANVTLYAKWALASGSSVWAKSVNTTGSAASTFYATAADSSGNVYAVGFQNGTDTYTYGPGVSATGVSSSANAVIVKYDSSGNALWAKVSASSNLSAYTAFSGVAVDSAGNAYVVGLQQSTTVDYGDGVIATSGLDGSHNAVIVKYDSSGTIQWAKRFSSTSGPSDFYGVAAASGAAYFGGAVYGTTDFTDGNVSAAGNSPNYNVVIVKYAQ